MNLKTIKYHLYKRWTGKPTWIAAYLFERACGRLGPSDVTIDAGANIGDVSAQLAATGATVHAFEPDPYAFGQLVTRFAGQPNVKLHQKALSNENGVTRLYRAPNFTSDPDLLSQSSSIYGDKRNISVEDYFDVEVIDIIAFIEGLGQPVNLLKIDVEGAEVPILEALLSTGVIDKVDLVFAETHEKKIPQLADRTLALKAAVARDWSKKINLDWH